MHFLYTYFPQCSIRTLKALAIATLAAAASAAAACCPDMGPERLFEGRPFALPDEAEVQLTRVVHVDKNLVPQGPEYHLP